MRYDGAGHLALLRQTDWIETGIETETGTEAEIETEIETEIEIEIELRIDILVSKRKAVAFCWNECKSKLFKQIEVNRKSSLKRKSIL